MSAHDGYAASDQVAAPTRRLSWLATLLSYAGRCRGRMIAALAFSLASVAVGLVPFYETYVVIQTVIDGGTPAQIWPSVGIAAAAFVLSKVLFGCSTVLSHISAYTILESLRNDVVDKLMRASLGTAQEKTAGQVKGTFVDRIETIEIPLAHMIPEMGGNLVLAVGIVIWIVCIDWRLALACAVGVPIGAIAFASGMRAFNRMYAGYMDANNRVNSVMVEYIEGIQVVKAFNQASGSYRTYSDAVRSFHDYTLAWFRGTWAQMSFTAAVMPSTLMGAVPAGVALYLAGAVTPAELGLAFVLALAVVGPMLKLSTFLNETKSMAYAVTDARAFLDLPELAEPDPASSATPRDVGVRLDHVSFSYETGEEVLHDVSLDVPAGSFVALVGPSGSGKSTIARLIARHWDATSGHVLVGGNDVRDYTLDALASQVSFVAQDNYLFDCSLRENIRLGCPDATDEEVRAAAKAACCDEFIDRLPQGLDTPVGEAGDALSGGERQRIAIARALLKDAPIVILDEATAFTDPENENRIQRSIARLSQGKTLLVIAHRLSTITGADQICLLDKGRITARGTHDELLERSDRYRRMWDAHIGARTWAAGSHGAGERFAAEQGFDSEKGCRHACNA